MSDSIIPTIPTQAPLHEQGAQIAHPTPIAQSANTQFTPAPLPPVPASLPTFTTRSVRPNEMDILMDGVSMTGDLLSPQNCSIVLTWLQSMKHRPGSPARP